MAVGKKVLERMCPTDFEDAYTNNNEKVLSEYIDYAKSVCGKLLQSQTLWNIPDRENIIEEASYDAILYLHKKLEEYDPEKGALSYHHIAFIVDLDTPSPLWYRVAREAWLVASPFLAS